jgi:hypothetical protein
LSRHLSFRQSLAYLEQQSPPPVDSVKSATVLNEAAAFYQEQLDRYPEALRYLVGKQETDNPFRSLPVKPVIRQLGNYRIVHCVEVINGFLVKSCSTGVSPGGVKAYEPQ